jgi:hypothetical protein
LFVRQDVVEICDYGLVVIQSDEVIVLNDGGVAGHGVGLTVHFVLEFGTLEVLGSQLEVGHVGGVLVGVSEPTPSHVHRVVLPRLR